MKIILKHDWMGSKKGAELNLDIQMAATLIDRGTAKSAEAEEHRSFRKKSKNRMVKHSPVEKIFTPNTG